MNKVLYQKLDRIMLLNTFLSKVQAETDAVLPLIAIERNKLLALRDDIFEAEGRVKAYNPGYAETKQLLREKLVDEAYMVGNAASIYYTTVVNDQTLRERARFLRTDMVRLTADALVNKARLISQTALPIKTLLLPYGVAEAQVTGLNAHIEAFFNEKDSPAEARALAKTARKDLIKLFKDADEVLERLDDLFRLLYRSHKLLFDQYQSSRKIKQQPTNRILKQALLPGGKRGMAGYARGYLKPQNSITLINESARTKGAALQFYFAAKKGDLPASTQPIIEVPAGSQKTIAIAKHGFSAATPVLMVFNPSPKKIRWKTRVVLKEKK